MILNLEDLSQFFQETTFLGNSLKNYGLFLLMLGTGLILKSFLSRLTLKIFFVLFKKFSIRIMIKGLYDYVKGPFENLILIIFLYLGFIQLNTPDFLFNHIYKDWTWIKTLQNIFRVIFVFTFLWVVFRIIDFLTKASLRRIKDIDNQDRNRQVYQFIKDLIKVLLFIITFLFILSKVFNINVISILAGLGIGGLAVALAGKESIENLFASFTIFLDRPFKIGEKVEVNDTTGFVEKVGFRSTRIRTLDRSLLILPNKQLVDQAVDNLSSRIYMRSRFTISLDYHTSLEQLNKVKQEIEELIENHHKLSSKDYHVRFAEFGAVGLELLIIYFVRTSSWDEYIAIKSDLNEEILKIIEENGCKITFPSTSVIVKGDRD